jgi:hypothetical protein
MMKLRWLLLGFVFLLGAEGGGCNNGVVGVQDYGAVTGRVIDAKTNRPVGGALVSVGSLYLTYADPKGAFTIPKVPIGDQDVVARAPGYDASAVTVRIKKDQTVSADYVKLFATNGMERGPTASPPPEASATPFVWWSPSPAPTQAPGASR